MASAGPVFKSLFPSRVRSNNGCWTCRLRRKKCDEKRPACEGCSSLEITCHFDDEKPEWMDGGSRQREMAERVKSQVKKQASQRRDRKYLQILEAGTKDIQLNDRDEPQAAGGTTGGRHPDVRTSRATSADDDSAHRKGSTSPPYALGGSETDPLSSMPSAPASETTNDSGHQPEDLWHLLPPLTDSSKEESDRDFDTHLIMIYLDYVFPYLFPFYRPPMAVGGRGWILSMLRNSSSLYHTAISLASYFFGVLLTDGDKEHDGCIRGMQDKLQVKLERGLRELSKEMCQINARNSELDRQRGISTLQSILKMLIFEVATSNKQTWQVHLDAAVALFLQLLPDPEQWNYQLAGLHPLNWPCNGQVVRPWSASQASFRFFTAQLLYIDILSSTTNEESPRLLHYKSVIAPGCGEFMEASAQKPDSGTIQMDEFLGLRNWVIGTLGQVAELAAWKREQVDARTLSMEELVCRGTPLLEVINGGLTLLEEDAQQGSEDASATSLGQNATPLLLDLNSSSARNHPNKAIHNLIWLQATQLYLYIIISGWQPSNPEIRRSADRLRDLLGDSPTATPCLQGQGWPFCVAGCLAPREDEETFRAMAARLGTLQQFGTIREAKEVMEAVWARRDRIDENWDIAKCLNVLGHGVLLI